MRKIPGGDWILTRNPATAAKAGCHASRDFNAARKATGNVNAPDVRPKSGIGEVLFSFVPLVISIYDGFQSHRHALPCPFSLERDQRPPAGAVAKPLPLVAHRDLLRSEDDADRLPGVLGIHVAGARQSLALS